MRAMEKRLVLLEGRGRPAGPDWGRALDQLNDTDLDRLESLVIRLSAGETIEDLPSADFDFLARIEDMATCVP